MANNLPTVDPVQNTMPRIASALQDSPKPDLSYQDDRSLPEAIPNQPATVESAPGNAEPSVRPAYFDYEPKPLLHVDSKNYCYRTYLDRLGFNTWDNPIALEARLQFIRDLKAHVCVPETTYLRKDDNPAAFNALIFGFFGRYGDRYWGVERDHLAEKDPLKGFLYPRDALRENSRYDLSFLHSYMTCIAFNTIVTTQACQYAGRYLHLQGKMFEKQRRKWRAALRAFRSLLTFRN